MDFAWLLVALFLPLFPLSAVFIQAARRLSSGRARVVLMLLWPQFGLLVIEQLDTPAPDWIAPWALLTALLYAVRALVERDLVTWISLMAVSTWALLWLALPDNPVDRIALYALGFGVPLALLQLLAEELRKRFDAAYAGLYGGLYQTLPRLSVILVIVVMAVIATPVFPGFFTMLEAVIVQVPVSPWHALGLVTTWLLWTWAGARLLHGLVIGPGAEAAVPDLSPASTLGYFVLVCILVFGGLWMIGGMT